MKHYAITSSIKDPDISLRLPIEILRDITTRAEENGSTIAIEIAKRLARTLERDLEMIEEDNELAFAAFEAVTK